MAWTNFNLSSGLVARKRGMTTVGLACFLLLTFLATFSFAGVDMTIFGPQKYDRLKGAPTVYTDVFDRCDPSDQALLRVVNGNDKDTSITAGRIWINGALIVADSDLKQTDLLIEKPITVALKNELKVELKSSSQDTSFLIIEIIGRGCDSVPPVISAPSPVDGALLNTARPAISASYDDGVNGSGIDTASVRLAVDGADVTGGASVTATGISYQPSSNLHDGDHTVVLAVADRAANKASLTWHFTTDTVPPDFTVTSPKNGDYLNTTTVDIWGTIDDPNAQVTINGLAATVTGRTFTFSGFPLVEFGNEIQIVAKDLAKNAASQILTVNLDTNPPVVSIKAPLSGFLTKGAEIIVEGEVSEEQTTVTVNDRPAQVTGRKFSMTCLLTEGANVINVIAADRAQNKGTANVTGTRDSIAPDAPVFKTFPSPTSRAAVPLSGTAESRASVTVLSGAAVIGTTTADGDGNFALEAVTLIEGTNRFTATATDAAGNESKVSDPLDIVLDATPPVLTVSTLADGRYTNKPTLNISGSATDNVGVKDLKINGVVVPVNADGSFSYAFSLQTGVNDISIVLTDLAELSASDSRKIYLDQNAPVITVTSPADLSKTAVRTVQVTGYVDKEAKVEITLKGVPLEVTRDGLNFAATASLEYDSNTIEITATDLATNQGSAKRTVVFDDRKPSLSVTNPGEDLQTNNANLLLKGTAGDLTAVHMKVTIVDQTFTPELVNGAFEQPVTFTEQKEYLITVTAIDEVENASIVERRVAYDIIPPDVGIDDVATPTNQASQLVKGTREANAEIVVSCATATFGAVSYPTSSTWSANVSGFTPGENDVVATAKDAAGNTKTTDKKIVYDVTAPTGTITINNGAATTGSAEVKLDLSAADVSGVTKMRFSTDGTIWSEPTAYLVTTPWSLIIGDGYKEIYVSYQDTAGNWSSDPIKAGITLDTTPPVVSATPAGGLFNAPQSVFLSANESSVIYYTTDGSAPTDGSAVYSQPVSVPVSGTVSFFAKDTAGNPSGFKTEKYTIDTVPPTVTITSPVADLLINNSKITVSGVLSEENCSVMVNGIPAAVTGTSFTLADYTLSERENNITVQATDRAGNPGSATVKVTLDSIAPTRPVIDSFTTPTNVATVTVTGSAEAGATVKLSNGTAPVATVTADPQGRYSVPGVTLAEGPNSFTATATDAANNQGDPSAPVTALLDTVAPTITVTTPQADSFLNTPQITVTGSVSEPLASLTLDGQAVTLTGTEFQKTVTLVPGLNTLTLVATDLAGNPVTKPVSVTLDTVAPVVTINAPVSGGSTNAAQVTVSGTVSEDNAAATVNGTPVTVTNQTFNFVYTLQEGDNTITVEATDRAGNKGSAAVTRKLDTQLPQISLLAPAEAAAGANLTVTVNASDNAQLGLVELKVDGVAVWSGGNAPSLSEPVSYRLSPSLAAGREVVFVTNGVDNVGNQGSATARVKITQGASGPGFIQGKVLDDQRGLLLAGAEVTVTDAKGTVSMLTTAEDGGYFTEAAAGSALVKLAKPGYTTVERVVSVLPESKVNPLDARLTPISSKVNLVDSSGAQVKLPLTTTTSLAAEVAVPSGALGVQADLRLTPVGNQGLPGVLPAGWSPVAAAELRLIDPSAGTVLDSPPAFAASLKFPVLPIAGITADSVVVLAAYDVVSHGWIAEGSAVPAADGSSVTAAIQGVGQYALLMADPAPNAPPAANQGQPLAAAVPTAINYDLTTAAGKVLPQASPPSTGLRAAGEVVLKVADGADPAPQFTSGLVLGGRVTERFDLHSGDRVDIPVYTQHLVLYRSPCVTNIGQGALTDAAAASVRATFPISPSRNFTIVDLLLGKVAIEILTPGAMVDGGGVMVGADGARLLDSDGNVLVIPAGALSQTTPVLTKNGKVAAGAVGPDFNLLKAVELNLTYQTLASSATLSIPLPSGLDPSLPLVVAKAIDVRGTTKLKLVTLAKISGSAINSDTSATGIALPGITTSGTYYFLQGKSALGFVSGTVTGASGTPFRGALVKTDTGSLVDLSVATGRYLVVAPASAFTATAVNLDSNDEGSVAGAIIAANQAVTVNLAIQRMMPQVVSVAPADQAINVQPSAQVVVTFSKKMDTTSINATTLKLAKADGSAVKGAISFNVEATAATFYPESALQSEASYRVTVDGSVKDVQGYQIGQSVASAFTVRKTTPPPMPAAGAVSGTFPDSDGFITVTGTQGSAEPTNTVLIINDNSGEIVSISAQSNGSFTGRVRGQLGDEIKVVLMDHSGNQTLISYITYKSDDGRCLVTAKGGKVEGEGGSVLEIPDGALIGPAIITMTKVVQDALPHPVQEGANFVSAVKIDTNGVPFQKEVQFSVPLPAGYDTTKTPFVATPDTVVNADGSEEKVFVIVDSAKVADGRLSTACAPFGGVMTPGIFAFFQFPTVGAAIVSGYTYQERNEISGYQPAPSPNVQDALKPASPPENFDYLYDRPIKGAVIRTPAAWNYVSYTNSSGFYAGYATVYGNVGAEDIAYTVTAIHPATMRRETLIAYLNADHNIQRLNFKLADKNTIVPDKTPPIIDLSLKVAPGQDLGIVLVAGTVPVGTRLQVPLTVTEQAMGAVTLTVDFKATGMSEMTSVQVGQGTSSLFKAMTADSPAIFRFTYQPQFASPIGVGSLFQPNAAGTYLLTVEATDAAGNKSQRSVQVRAVSADAIPGGIDGPPVVDKIIPDNGGENVAVGATVNIYFNEPVVNVTANTVKLIDKTTGLDVPSALVSSFESGKMITTIRPDHNLFYSRKYEVSITRNITDATPNPSVAGQLLQLDKEYHSTFTTMGPHAFDMAQADQFTGGRDIDLYTHPNGNSYAYITTGVNGWRVADVTDPTTPFVVSSKNNTNSSVSWEYRGVAVHPNQGEGLMAMTENIVWNDGNQFGYIRFYDILSDPANPVIVGREKINEAYSGIPGRVAMQGDYAYVASAASALQVVSISAAKENVSSGRPSDGFAIVGAFDSYGQGYGSPNDIVIYGQGKALLTTNSKNLLVLDINSPVPSLISLIPPSQLGSLRVAASADFSYLDDDYNAQTMDVALSGGNGKLTTLDLTDPYNPHVLTTVKDENLNDVPSIPYDISINKDQGLAYVTTLNSIQVIDIRNPYAPKLLKEITQLPNADGNMIYTGSTPALIEKNGLVYLASQAQGLKIVDLISPYFFQVVTEPDSVTVALNAVSLLNPWVASDATVPIITTEGSTQKFITHDSVIGDPKMPTIRAKVNANGIVITSQTPVRWKTKVAYTVNSKLRPRKGLATNDGFLIPASGFEADTGLYHNIQWGEKFGGGQIEISADVYVDGGWVPAKKFIGTIEGEKTSSDFRTIMIDYMKNKTTATFVYGGITKSSIETIFGSQNILWAKACIESNGINHFFKSKFGVPAGSSYPIENGATYESTGDGGLGVLQLTNPLPSYLQAWNWKKNVDGAHALTYDKIYDSNNGAIGFAARKRNIYPNYVGLSDLTGEALMLDVLSLFRGGHYYKATSKGWKINKADNGGSVNYANKVKKNMADAACTYNH